MAKGLITMGVSTGETAIRTAGSTATNLFLGIVMFVGMLVLFLNIPQDAVAAYVRSNAIAGYSLSPVVAGDISNNVPGVFGVLEVSTLVYALSFVVRNLMCLAHMDEGGAIKVISCLQGVSFWLSSTIACCILMFAALYLISPVMQDLPFLSAEDDAVVEVVASIISFCAIMAMLILFLAGIIITVMGFTGAGDSRIAKVAASLNRYQPLLWLSFVVTPTVISLVLVIICVVLVAAVTAIIVAIFSVISMILIGAVIAGTIFVIIVRELFGF